MPDPRDELAQAWLENDPGMAPPRDPTAGPRQMWQQGYASPQPTPQNQRVLGKGIGALMHGASEVLQIPDRMFEGARVERDPAATWQQVEQAQRQQVEGAAEAALNLLGTGAPLAAARPGATVGSSGGVLRGKPGGPHPGGIQVYHSSPHDFDKFDWSKLRTGEGANTYGAGFYFAENPAVSGQGGQYWNSFLQRFEGTPEGHAASRLRAQQYDREHAINSTRRDYEDWKNSPGLAQTDPAYREKMMKLRAEELRLLESGAPVGPRTYEVNIKAKPEELLDWDKPLHAQPQHIDQLYRLLPHMRKAPRATGESFYDVLQKQQRGDIGTLGEGQIRASQALNDAGIPGIRYLDQGSRGGRGGYSKDQLAAQLDTLQADLAFAEAKGVGKPDRLREQIASLQSQISAMPAPSYNYVVTDPSKLDILAKYGIVGGTAGGIGSVVDPSRYRETY